MLMSFFTAVSTHDSAKASLVWIDGVGTFQLLMQDEVSIGRVSSNDGPQIGLMANLSRRHAVIQRVREDYILEPVGPTKLGGRVITSPSVLPPQAEITLGESVRVEFHIPSPLSASARLEVTSSHRGPVSITGSVLMAETCLIGPGPENHIRCPNWSGSVVLARQSNGFAVRSRMNLTVDGTPQTGLISVRHGQTIAGPDFRFRIE